MYLCIACLALIWLYVTFHLRSLFLSSVAMLNIATSIPMALVLYNLVFGISFFSLLHILVLLIILGIGADNTFIFNDTWNSTKDIPALKDNLENRAAYTFRKASKAIIATSITNLVAFLGTCFSSIMPITAFGIFAIIIVTLNYILIIFILPTQYIFYEKFIINLFSWKSVFNRLYRFLGCLKIHNFIKGMFNRARVGAFEQ